jgi:hypothetical protein
MGDFLVPERADKKNRGQKKWSLSPLDHVVESGVGRRAQWQINVWQKDWYDFDFGKVKAG